MATNGRRITSPTRYSCLAVDDEPAVLSAYELVLSDHYTVHLAESGEEALELLKRVPVHVVLLDLKLPGMDGIEVLRCIRKEKPDLPVIIVSGKSDHEAAKEAANLGVAGYLDKPYNVEELHEKIETALGRVIITRNCTEGPRGAHPSDLAAAVQRFIRRHYAEKLTLPAIAKVFSVSPRHLRRLFREKSGMSVMAYLIRVRIDVAATLILGSDLPIKAIPSQVGYASLSLFYNHFERLTGLTPDAYRQQLRLLGRIQ